MSTHEPRLLGGPPPTTRKAHRLPALIGIHLWFSWLVAAAPPAEAPLDTVDFRYATPWWQTAICLPDDPDKILAGKEGQVLVDFLGYPLRNFAITLQPDIAEGARWVRQQTVSARAPIVQTWRDAGGVEVLEEIFVVTPAPGQSSAPARLARIDDQLRQRKEGWAKPPAGAAFAWSGVELAQKDLPMRYALAVPARTKRWIVFGFCEGQHTEPGQRRLVLQAEGADPKAIDPVANFGANQPGLCTLVATDANGDGLIELSVGSAANAADPKPALNALWIFAGPPPSDQAIIAGDASEGADAWLPGQALPARRTVILVTLRNTTVATAARQPILRVASVAPVSQSARDGQVLVSHSTRISASSRLAPLAPPAGKETVLRLPALTLHPGESQQVAFTVDRNADASVRPLTVAQARAARDATRQWWETADLPYTTIQVPDAGIQAMIESSVRNIWQAREIKRGLPAYHVGPTVYRGLWVVDGAFLLESAAMLGRAKDARAGIDYLLSHQKPDGSFDRERRYWKENGIVLWAATRQAILTQDREWLRARWPALQRVVQAMKNLRAKASIDPSALDYRLLPPGFVDGGLSNRKELKPEFSNTYWCVVGLKAAVAAARWLGDTENAAAWQSEYDDFYATLRRAMTRDLRKDSHGHDYVPMMMANAGDFPPQKGQWPFCHAIYPGQLFASDDPLVASQLAMLRETKVEGMVFDTGWVKDGIWNYFASFYGHAQLWQGHGREAAQALYDFAQHAAPTRIWREEQMPLGKGTQEFGDMPHNWASAEFIRLAAHLIALDRGDELHLLEGFPREWTGPGMVTRLNGVFTPFGPLHLEVRVADDGKRATVKVAKLTARPPAKIVLHLAGLTREARAVELPVNRDTEMTFPR